MRTVEIEVFTFNELDERAKENARSWFRLSDDFDSSEFVDSANAFAEIAPIRITQWDSHYGSVSFNWTDCDDIAELSGLRAWKWLNNNGWFEWAKSNANGDCALTGVFSDCYFGEAIKEYEKTPLQTPELEQVFYEAAQAWVYAMKREIEYRQSDEYVDETIESNEYEFLKNGEIY